MSVHDLSTEDVSTSFRNAEIVSRAITLFPMAA